MKDYIEISKRSVKGGQIITFIIATVFLTIISINLIISFSFVTLIVFSLAIGCFYFALFNKSRDIYYEDGKIYVSNLFHKKEYDISMFVGVYSRAFLNYSIRFKDGKEYYFRLLFEDIKLFFKSDSDFYAKKLNNQLLGKLNSYKSKDVF